MTPDLFREVGRTGPQEAPPSVEAALLSRFRQTHRSSSPIRFLPYAIGAVAAIAAGMAIVFFRMPVDVPPPTVTFAHAAVPNVPVPGKERPAVKRSAKPTVMYAEVATDFYPLPDAAAPFESGVVVRVQLPRSALRTIGLPMNQERSGERITADVLLGQDGLARAVRFIQ